MSELEDESIHLMLTSPPYWCIKDYSHQDQIGYNQTYEEYISDIKKVLLETYRVLKPGCRAVVNIGDQYLRAKDFGRYRVQPIPADIIIQARDIGFDFMYGSFSINLFIREASLGSPASPSKNA